MKGKRFTLLTRTAWAVPLILCLLLAGLSVPAYAITQYVVESEAAGQHFSNYTGNCLHSGANVTGLADLTPNLGSEYGTATVVGKFAQFSYTPAAGDGGYYDVYAAWPTTSSGWTMVDYSAMFEGSPIFPGLTTRFNQVNAGNAWKLLASGKQLTPGTPYTVYGTINDRTGATTGSRLLAYAAKWVYVRSNTPSGLTATPKLDGSAIDLAWSAPASPAPTPDHYIIERGELVGDPGENWAPIITVPSGFVVTGLTYSDPTGVCDITYWYRVKAVDTAGIVSGPSNNSLPKTKCVTAAPGKATGPIPTDGLTVVQTDIPSLAWTAGTAATSHDVYFGTNSASLTKVSNAQSTATYAQGALAANTTYYWRIDEKNSGGTTTGDLWSFKTGVSLTVKAIRANNHGSIVFYSVGTGNTTDATRAWDVTTWHEAGEVINIAAGETSPFTWVGWSLNASGSSPFSTNRELSSMADPANPFIIPTTNTTLYAVFAGTQYQLTTAVNPSGGGSIVATDQSWPSATLSQFEVGEVAHLVATPAAGYLFAGWVSDKTGAFVDPFNSTTNYTMTADAVTTVTAYFAHAMTSITDYAPLTIIASSLAGADDASSNVNLRLGAYTTAPVLQAYARLLCSFGDWANISSIPNLSLRNGLGRLTAQHTFDGSYDSTLTTHISAFAVTRPWNYPQVVPGATWLYSDRTVGSVVSWTTPGGDMGTELGTAQPFVGVLDETKAWTLPTGVDYRALLANGIELKSAEEGVINDRKGVAKTVTLNFFYDPPSGAANVIRNWAYLGFYAQGLTDTDVDHLARLDDDSMVAGTFYGVPVDVTTLYPSTGKTYGAASWAVGSSPTDIVDLLGTSFMNGAHTFGSTYVACYVKNPGAAVYPTYVGLGADDYARVWTSNNMRGSKLVKEGVIVDKAMIGPFTLGTGWTRLLIKVEQGTGGTGLTARLANADRTALTGLGAMTFATTDSTAPSNPTASVGGTATHPIFTFAGAADPETSGEGVSGLRGFKVYFGTNVAGVPSAFQTAWTVDPGVLTVGTYYLRVSAVDNALNGATPATASTFVVGSSHVASYGLTNKAVLDSVAGSTFAATKNFTVWGTVTVTNANSFTVDDGSGAPVTVNLTAHGFANGDYVSATGTLSVGPPAVLTALYAKKQN
jgi:hypothetical protein